MADLFGMLQAAAGTSAGGDYQISRSLRFNSADSAYLSRTPASAGNRKTWTWSGWVKRSALTNNARLFCAQIDNSNRVEFMLNNDTDNFMRVELLSSSSNGDFVTNQLFRDVSAWYHIVLAVDTTQATNTNRVKIYVNGEQITSFSSATYPNQNIDYAVNNNVEHNIGRSIGYARHFSGYLAEVHFVDGSALTPSSFGETNATTGVWSPIEYTGSYGTNGFYLDFSDNTSTTTLGYDAAGSNDWTLNNFSVAAGAGNDSLVDSPTQYGTDTGAGGEVRGNYCTLNPLKQTGASLTNGNLQFTKAGGSGGTLFTIHSTLFVSTGKWYFEVTPTSVVAGWDLIGVAGPEVPLATYSSLASMTGNIWAYRNDATKVNNGSSASYGNTWTSNDVIGVAVDMDNSKIWFSKNGTWQASGDPAAGTSAAYTNLSGSVAPILIDQGSGTFDGSINTGQRPFAYTAPSGFKALCTTNLPDPTVLQGDDHFNTVLYSGSSTTPLTVTGVGFEPDMVWLKSRTQVWIHGIFTRLNGIGAGNGYKYLSSNNTGSESDQWGAVTFNSDGWSGVSSGYNGSFSHDFGAAGQTYVSWNWKANGAGSSNTAGTITSTVSANTTAGISIVTYTGNATAGATVGHGLGVAPSMIIIKNRDDSAQSFWCVYHKSAFVSGADPNVLYLNSTQAQTDDTNVWGNSPSFTSTIFALGDYNGSNGSGDGLVAYCFAEVEGFSKFGSYTGNGSADGPFVYTGFRPAFVIIKRTDTTGEWVVFDNKRDGYNVNNDQLYPNSNAVEEDGQTYNFIDLISNGFKCRNTATDKNASGGTYIYMAFSSNPFKYALAR